MSLEWMPALGGQPRTDDGYEFRQVKTESTTNRKKLQNGARALNPRFTLQFQAAVIERQKPSKCAEFHTIIRKL